jgi:hypothetical protein
MEQVSERQLACNQQPARKMQPLSFFVEMNRRTDFMEIHITLFESSALFDC